jgi:hypothetical protein
MKPGESGYTMPWAMFQKMGIVYLNGNYPIHKRKRGTSCLKITRTTNVDIIGCPDEKFAPDGGNGYIGNFFPVVVEKLITPNGEIGSGDNIENDISDDDLRELWG